MAKPVFETYGQEIMAVLAVNPTAENLREAKDYQAFLQGNIKNLVEHLEAHFKSLGLEGAQLIQDLTSADPLQPPFNLAVMERMLQAIAASEPAAAERLRANLPFLLQELIAVNRSLRNCLPQTARDVRLQVKASIQVLSSKVSG